MSTLKAALLGRSLAHSVSPEVHEAIFPHVRLTAMGGEYDRIEYRNIECQNESALMELLRRGVTEAMCGFNVTFPYKEFASRLAGKVDPLARGIHSANTIALVPGGLRVYSTDGLGFRQCLRKELPDLTPETYQFVVIGAGGAARAVVEAVRNMSWGQMTACARSIEHARLAFGYLGTVNLRELHALKRTAMPHFIVQATPVGQRSGEALLEDFDWEPGDIAVDLVYNPLRTRFLDIAAQGGATIISGLGMLIEQAALSQCIWLTGEQRTDSPLTLQSYQEVYTSLSKILTARWDGSAI